jgi:membrane-associated phospholipid phosphatase
MVQPLDDLPQAMLITICVLTLGVRAWSALDPASPVAAPLRRFCSTRLVVSLLACGIFAVVAGDVLEAERGDLIPMLDHAVRPVARASAELPGVRVAAATLSWLTGEGLALALLGAALILWVRERETEAAVIVAGTLGAWGASGLFKLLLGIPRPNPGLWQYAFPSGHAFVSLVAFGLMAWVAGRRGSSVRQTWLMAAAVAIAVLTGFSRLLLDMHWLSDVVGGLAVGTVWLNATIAVAERRLAPGLPPRPPTKRWKFSATDVRERQYWDEYMRAYEDAIRETATSHAPWYVVPADHKWFTRCVVAAAASCSAAGGCCCCSRSRC